MKLSAPKWATGAAGIALAVAIGGTMFAHFEDQAYVPGTEHRAFRDTVGVGQPWTICFGHTKGVKAGDVATDAQCKAWLDEDMRNAIAVVDRCIATELTVTQLAALAGATGNLGPQVVCGSTLQRKANEGDMRGMCTELDRWNKITVSGEKVSSAYQTKRRQTEHDLCWNGLK